jgi:predicted nucleic acid-binding protein
MLMPVTMPGRASRLDGAFATRKASPLRRSLRTRLGTHKQLTDAHLAALATARKGRLVTFDRGMSHARHPGDRAIVELLPVT